LTLVAPAVGQAPIGPASRRRPRDAPCRARPTARWSTPRQPSMLNDNAD